MAVACAAPQYHTQHEDYEQHYAPAQYKFNYDVHDEHTGDIKSHEESRHGDQVQGKYSLIDSDGYRRTVEYTADKHHGFNAIVHREPVHGHKQIQHAPIVHHVPIVQHAVPVATHAIHHAPIFHPVQYHNAAPLTKIVAHHSVPHLQHSDGHHSSHVSFSGPASHYQY